MFLVWWPPKPCQPPPSSVFFGSLFSTWLLSSPLPHRPTRTHRLLCSCGEEKTLVLTAMITDYMSHVWKKESAGSDFFFFFCLSFHHWLLSRNSVSVFVCLRVRVRARACRTWKDHGWALHNTRTPRAVCVLVSRCLLVFVARAVGGIQQQRRQRRSLGCKMLWDLQAPPRSRPLALVTCFDCLLTCKCEPPPEKIMK